jgi:hypothetical protein
MLEANRLAKKLGGKIVGVQFLVSHHSASRNRVGVKKQRFLVFGSTLY